MTIQYVNDWSQPLVVGGLQDNGGTIRFRLHNELSALPVPDEVLLAIRTIQDWAAQNNMGEFWQVGGFGMVDNHVRRAKAETMQTATQAVQRALSETVAPQAAHVPQRCGGEREFTYDARRDTTTFQCRTCGDRGQINGRPVAPNARWCRRIV